MKNYAHIISKLFYEPAVITPSRHAALCHLLENRLSGNIPRVMEDDDGVPRAEDTDDSIQKIGDTAIIPVHGTLVAHPEDIAMSECGCDMESLGQMIDAAEIDPKIKRMVLDFRTPGGVVTKIPETGRKLLSSRKETIAFTDSECCSGGLWLASQCQRFYATESSRVGSCGVYVMCLDMSRAMENEGVKVNAISAGKYKLLGASWKPLTEDERAKLQERVDKIYGSFKEAVATYREVKDEHFGNGLVFDGEEAAAIGFTDGVVESIEDILEDMV